MDKIGITSAEDISGFFRAYNERQYDVLFEKYMSEDCFWYASEKALRGKEEMLDYWTSYHSACDETLGMPEHVVFGDGCVYLQVKIRLDFTEDGLFFGKAYKKGDVCQFGCVDYYELNEEKKTCSGLVYIKFFNDGG
jgi:hypothetical protein